MIRRLGAGMLVGAWLGGMTANLLSASTLNIIIGCFAWTMALQMGLNLKPKAERHLPGRSAPASPAPSSAGCRPCSASVAAR